jgi:hypothetical protein
MINWEGRGRNLSWHILIHYFRIFLQRLMKAREDLMVVYLQAVNRTQDLPFAKQ